MRLTRQLLFTLLLLSFLSARAQKRSISLKEGLNLNFTGLADVELVVQWHTVIGENPSSVPWYVVAQSRTVPTSGFRVADSFYVAHAVATCREDGDSVYNSFFALRGWQSELPLRLNEDSGCFRIPLPAAFHFSVPVHQPLLDSNLLTEGTQFTWQPAPGAADPVFVEIRYDRPVVSGKRGHPSVERRFFLPDTGNWIVGRRLLKGIPAGGIVSIRFNRGRFLTYRSGPFRYEAAVYEGADSKFIRR